MLESASRTCTYAGIYVLAIEWLSSKYLVLGCTMIAVSYAMGELLLGVVAMYIHDFRTLIRVLYTPGLFLQNCVKFACEIIYFYVCLHVRLFSQEYL